MFEEKGIEKLNVSQTFEGKSLVGNIRKSEGKSERDSEADGRDKEKLKGS